MSRDNILHKVRTALGRSPSQPVPPPPPVRLRIPEVSLEARIVSMLFRVSELNGKTLRVPTMDAAREFVAELIAGKSSLASNSPFLAECGISTLPGVTTGITDLDALRASAASVDIGITSADYALCDTGTLVMLSSPAEARLISLLPFHHVAVVPAERILTSLDELFTVLPRPAEQSSSMVLITGPSRTADIELVLVRGVHGPGFITVVVVG